MRRSFIALAASLELCGAALAQTPQLTRQCVGTAASCAPVSAAAPLPVISSGSGALASQVQGNVASGATDSGNPVKVGGKYNTTLPTFTDGQRGDIQIDNRGRALIANSNLATGSDAFSNAALVGLVAAGDSATGVRLQIIGSYNFNGTTWDRGRNIIGATAAGTGTAAVAMAPTSAAAGAITPVVSTAAEGSRVLKAGAGNLYSLVTTTGGTAGYVMVFNATSAPADGAVTPIECIVVAANSTVTINYASMPSAYSTGITAVLSSTGCFSKTISATAFFSGKVQ